MTADRMERVREKAREAFPYPDDDRVTATGRWRQRQGFIAGYEAAMTLTDAEWEQAREDVDRAVWDGELPMADAAMWALGFKREGE